MSTVKHEKQSFRHRGFEPNDGSDIVMQFGSDPAPVNVDGTPMKKLWDNLVEQAITVTKFIEVPLAPPAEEAGTIADPVPTVTE